MLSSNVLLREQSGKENKTAWDLALEGLLSSKMACGSDVILP
jgi:hypothetical protein